MCKHFAHNYKADDDFTIRKPTSAIIVVFVQMITTSKPYFPPSMAFTFLSIIAFRSEVWPLLEGEKRDHVTTTTATATSVSKELGRPIPKHDASNEAIPPSALPTRKAFEMASTTIWSIFPNRVLE